MHTAKKKRTYGGFLKCGYPKIIHLNGIVHYQATICGYPHTFNTSLNNAVQSLPLSHGQHLRKISAGWAVTTCPSSPSRNLKNRVQCGFKTCKIMWISNVYECVWLDDRVHKLQNLESSQEKCTTNSIFFNAKSTARVLLHPIVWLLARGWVNPTPQTQCLNDWSTPDAGWK